MKTKSGALFEAALNRKNKAAVVGLSFLAETNRGCFVSIMGFAIDPSRPVNPLTL
jgi:hypothetical protein